MSNETYYEIDSFEAGAINTGSRSANYHCWCNILNSTGEKIDSTLNDVFYGRWSKCESVIKRWRKNCESAGCKAIIELNKK